jgi:hypothetical protein
VVAYFPFVLENDMMEQPWTHLEDSAIIAAHQLCDDKHFMLAEAMLYVINSQKNIRWSAGMGLGLMKNATSSNSYEATAAAALSAVVSSSVEFSDDSPAHVLRSARQIRDRYQILRASPRFSLIQASNDVLSLINAVRACVNLPGKTHIADNKPIAQDSYVLARAVLSRGQQSIASFLSKGSLTAMSSVFASSGASTPTSSSSLKHPAIIPGSLVQFAESANNESLRRIPPQLPGLPPAPTNVLKGSGLMEAASSSGNSVAATLHPSHQQTALSNKTITPGGAEYDPLSLVGVVLTQPMPHSLTMTPLAPSTSDIFSSLAPPMYALPPTTASPMISPVQYTGSMPAVVGPYAYTSQMGQTPSPSLSGASPLITDLMNSLSVPGSVGSGSSTRTSTQPASAIPTFPLLPRAAMPADMSTSPNYKANVCYF